MSVYERILSHEMYGMDQEVEAERATMAVRHWWKRELDALEVMAGVTLGIVLDACLVAAIYAGMS